MAREQFDDEEVAHLIWRITVINEWNRIGGYSTAPISVHPTAQPSDHHMGTAELEPATSRV